MRRRKINKINRVRSKYIICIWAIIMLNIMGISYAQWSDGINISGFISSGNLTPIYNGSYTIKQASENDTIYVRFEDVDNDGYSDIMYVNGEIEEGSSPMLDFNIENAGTMPMKYQEKYSDTKEKIYRISTGVIEPQQEITDQINIVDLLNQNQEEQIYTIPFVQWNAR